MPSLTERRIPMTLTDTQLVLLSAASQREDGGIELAPNLKGGAAHRVLGKLLSQGLIEEIPAQAPAEEPRDSEQAADLVSNKRPGRVAAARAKKTRTEAS